MSQTMVQYWTHAPFRLRVEILQGKVTLYWGSEKKSVTFTLVLREGTS